MGQVRPLSAEISSAFSLLQKGEPGNGEKLAKFIGKAIAHDKKSAAAIQMRELLPDIAALANFESDEQTVLLAKALRLSYDISQTKPVPKAAPLSNDLLLSPTSSIKGVGPKISEALAQKGLHSVFDLLWYLPRKYLDLRKIYSLGELQESLPETCAFIALVERSRFAGYGARRWFEAVVRDPNGEARMTLRWFHAHAGLAKQVLPGDEIVLVGAPTERDGKLECANPKLFGSGESAEKEVAGVWPVYSAIEDVAAKNLRKICQSALEYLRHLQDAAPEPLLTELQLPGIREALLAIHAPSRDISEDELETLASQTSVWHQRLALEELFILCIKTGPSRPVLQKSHRYQELTDETWSELPFAPTSAQRAAMAEIAANLASDIPMSRLLQGDVGSGKTAVAYAAAKQVATAGHQVAWMAPTEILAEQHASVIKQWASTAGLRTACITGSMPKPSRESLLRLLAAGQIDILLGTHALLSGDVEFANLGLVIVDEQHRFGVMQRAKLRRRDSDFVPHLLVMTATPIPRSLALTLYGDLQKSVLNELPPGRTPITTAWKSGATGLAAAQKAIALNAVEHRVFVIVPLIEATEELPLWDVAKAYSWVSSFVDPKLVAGLHGKIPGFERSQLLGQFRQGDLRVLCSTTVIEVGVDIPEATLMVILHPERFGLAQLHQLRGRVGRGKSPGKCLLVTTGRVNEVAAARLEAFTKHTDGFLLAEEDLKIRGPGELWGLRQAGMPALQVGDLVRDVSLLTFARQAANQILADDPELTAPQHASIAKALTRMPMTTLIGEEAG